MSAIQPQNGVLAPDPNALGRRALQAVPRVQEAHMKALASIFQSGDYSDLVINSSMYRYKVHRAIVCPQSDVFKRMLQSRFREAETGVINLPEDDVGAVHHMVQYFYTLEYRSTPPAKETPAENTPAENTSVENTSVENTSVVNTPVGKPTAARVSTPKPRTKKARILAARAARQARAARMAAAHNPSAAAAALVVPDTDVMELPDADADTDAVVELQDAPATLCRSEGHPCVDHARVYTIADRYAIVSLKELALARFRDAASEGQWDKESMLAVAREAYESTMTTDRGLRDSVTEVFVHNKATLSSEGWRADLQDMGELLYDILCWENGGHVAHADDIWAPYR